MNRPTALLLSFVLIAVEGGAQQHIHKRELKHKLMFKGALIKTGISAVWGEARNSPREWGRTWEGFAKRAGSAYAQRAVKGVVEFSISSALTHEDLRYHRSGLQGTWPRMKYALVRSFWVPRDVGDGHTFAVGRIVGAFTAGQVSRTWMPTRVATLGAGVSSGGVSIGLDVGLNVAREFWPKRR
jgi:hypothetical protein